MPRSVQLERAPYPSIAPLVVLPRESPESPSDLISRVCRERSISTEAFLGRARTRWICDARREVARDLHGRGMALDTIGAFLGGRDHSTVRYLIAGRA